MFTCYEGLQYYILASHWSRRMQGRVGGEAVTINCAVLCIWSSSSFKKNEFHQFWLPKSKIQIFAPEWSALLMHEKPNKTTNKEKTYFLFKKKYIFSSTLPLLCSMSSMSGPCYTMFWLLTTLSTRLTTQSTLPLHLLSNSVSADGSSSSIDFGLPYDTR